MPNSFITPSISALLTVTAGDLELAQELKQILISSRSQLELLPAAQARLRECWHPPATWDLRMTCLDRRLGTHGVESFQLRDQSWVSYLNAGNSDVPTIVRYRGNYRVRDWESIAEHRA